MSTDERELGPVDYLVVEWPAGAKPSGEGLRALVDLVDRGLIRVIDFAFVQKAEDGAVKGVAIADFDHDGTLDLAQFEGASSGILRQDDFDETGKVLDAGTSAAILVFENTWAAPFVTAVRKTGAQVVSSGRIPVQTLIDALDQTEPAES